MARQESEIAGKPRGRRPTGIGQMIGVRLQPDALARLDEWIRSRPGSPSRPEAIRRLIDMALPRTVEVSVSKERHSWGGEAVMTKPAPKGLEPDDEDAGC